MQLLWDEIICYFFKVTHETSWSHRPKNNCEIGQIWVCRAFSEEHMERMARILTCWWILTTFKTDYILAMVCWLSYFCHVRSVAPCLSDWRLVAKGCRSYQIPRFTCCCVAAKCNISWCYVMFSVFVWAAFLHHYNDVIMSAMAPQITSHISGLLNGLFRRGSKTTSKLRVTGLCEGNSPVTGEFPAQRACNAENVSIWWRHHVIFRRQHFWIRHWTGKSTKRYHSLLTWHNNVTL